MSRIVPIRITLVFCLSLFGYACQQMRTATDQKWQYYLERVAVHFPTDTSLCWQYVDSARMLVKEQQLNDSFLIFPLQWESRLYRLSDRRQQAFTQLDSAILLAKQGHYSTILLRLYEQKGRLHFQNEAFREAENWYLKAAQLAIDLVREEDAGRLRMEAGIAQLEMEDFKKAQQTFLGSLNTFEKYNDLSNLAKTQSNIGVLYNRLGDTTKAVEYYKKALDTYIQKPDSLSISILYMNLGTMHRKKNPDSSFYYFDLSDRYLRKGVHRSLQIKLLFNRAIVYSEKQQYRKAVEMFDSVLTLSRHSNMLSGMARAFLSLSISNSRMGDLLKAASLSDSAIHFALKSSEKMILNTCYENKMEILFKQQKFRDAFETSELARKHSDSLDAISAKLAIRKMENDFENQKKELENVRLSQLLEQQQQFSRRQTAALVFFIILSTVMGILYRHNRILQRERAFAYDALMEKYVQEKENREECVIASVSGDFSSLITGSNPTLQDRLIHYFHTEKPHHDPALKRATVEEYLQVTDKELTQALREHRTRSFNSFVNLFRVEEVKRRMEDPAYSHFTIEALALEAGFGSRQNFYKVFESMTGVKPSHYRARFQDEANGGANQV
jgi:tetratricopeptide (TPR) repeat protein